MSSNNTNSMIVENELMNDLTNILAEIHKFTETNIAKPFNEFTEKNIAKPFNELTDTTMNYFK